MLPISAWIGDNLIKPSPNMPWWTGVGIQVPASPNKGVVHVRTLLDALEKMVFLPTRNPNAAMRTPISGVYKVKGTGDVVTGRVEQGMVRPAWRWSSFRPTPRPTSARARSSSWRCTSSN